MQRSRTHRPSHDQNPDRPTNAPPTSTSPAPGSMASSGSSRTTPSLPERGSPSALTIVGRRPGTPCSRLLMARGARSTRIPSLQVSAGSRKPARTPSGRWSRVPTGAGSSSTGRAGSDSGTPPPATSNGHGSITPQIRYRTRPVPRELLDDQAQTVGGGRGLLHSCDRRRSCDRPHCWEMPGCGRSASWCDALMWMMRYTPHHAHHGIDRG